MLPGGGKTSRRQFPKTRATWGHFTAKIFTLTACFLTLYGWQERIIMNKSRSWVWQGEKQELAAVQYLLLRTPLFLWKYSNFFTACFEQFWTLHGLFMACWRPSIFHRKIYFYTACFELLGGGHSHLATLRGTVCRQVDSLYPWGPPKEVIREQPPLKGPKHDQVEGEFFYIKQTRMVRWLRVWWKKFILFMIGADIRHFVFLANAEHTLQIM